MNMRHTIIPAVYLILVNELGEYCLTRRFQTGYMDGFYSLPAGHLDGGESLAQAMVREAKEETGVDINTDDLMLVHVSNNLDSDPERIDFFYQTNTWQGDVSIMEPDKCDHILWVKPEDFPENITPTVRLALTAHTQGHRNYSEHWGYNYHA